MLENRHENTLLGQQNKKRQSHVGGAYSETEQHGNSAVLLPEQ